MTPKKTTTPLVLMIFTLMCALPVAAGAVPTAIAQEDDITSLDEEDLASGIVSDVLDGGSDDEDDNDNEENDSDAAGGDTSTQVTAPITDQDQTTADIAENRAANLDLEVVREQPSTPTPPEVVREQPSTPTPPEGEEPPEFVVFCFLDFLDIDPILCFDTLQECQEAQLVVGGGRSQCFGSETFPLGSRDCVVLRDATGQPIDVTCTLL